MMEKSKHKEYQAARKKLIPHAARYANKLFGKDCNGDKEEWIKNWNKAYLCEMDRLAKEQRL